MKSNETKRIIYQEKKPESKLSTFVKSFWYFKNEENENQNYSILPDGCFDLLIYFRENSEKEIYLTGLWNKKIEVSIPANTKILAIRFNPISAEYIIQKSIVDLLNAMVKISSKNYEFLNQINTEFQDFNSFITSNTIKLQSIFGTKNEKHEIRQHQIISKRL